MAKKTRPKPKPIDDGIVTLRLPSRCPKCGARDPSLSAHLLFPQRYTLECACGGNNRVDSPDASC